MLPGDNDVSEPVEEEGGPNNPAGPVCVDASAPPKLTTPEFPMATVRIARPSGRHILLWPNEETREDYPDAQRLNGAFVGQWSPDERAWWVLEQSDGVRESGWFLIDDDFIGWGNLPPFDGALASAHGQQPQSIRPNPNPPGDSQ